MRSILKSLIIILTLSPLGWSQCARMVPNPLTGQMDCTGVDGTGGGVGGAASLTAPYINALTRITAAGVIGPSDLSCATGGVCTLFNATGPNTLVVRVGSAQGTNPLMQFKDAAGAVMSMIGPYGEIGIGRVSPALQLGALDVVGYTTQAFNVFNAASGNSRGISFDVSDTNQTIYTEYNNTGAYSKLILATGGSYKAAQLVLDTNGRVGVGTLTPAYQLDVNGTAGATPGGTVPARKDYTLVCQANLTSGTLTSIVVLSNAATATCTAGGCGMINGQTAYVIGATSDTDLNKAYTVTSSGVTDTTVTFTTASVANGTYEVGSDAGMSFQGCLLNGASYTGNIAAATTIRPVLFNLTAGSKMIGNTVYWPAAWTGPGTLTGSVGATSGADDTFYAAASNLMAATSFLDTSSYKSKLHAAADDTVLALTANTNFGDATLPILKLNGSVTVSVTW